MLALLIVLGVRRLRPRRTRLGAAALAPAGFTLWSLSGVFAAARDGSVELVLAVWATALILGASTALVHKGPRPAHQGRGVFLFRGSVVPLLIYLTVFAARYTLGVWAVFEPEKAELFGLIAIAISAATAGRFLADFAPLLREARGPTVFAEIDARTN